MLTPAFGRTMNDFFIRLSVTHTETLIEKLSERFDSGTETLGDIRPELARCTMDIVTGD
jgi:hypothetical protein